MDESLLQLSEAHYGAFSQMHGKFVIPYLLGPLEM